MQGEDEAMSLQDYPEYLLYARYKHSGLRKEALKHLDAFLASCANWNATEKRTFVRAFFEEQSSEEYHYLECFPLTSQILYPVLQAWYEEMPEDYLPYYGYAFLLRHSKAPVFRRLWLSQFPHPEMAECQPLEPRFEYKAIKQALVFAPENEACRRFCLELLIDYLHEVHHDQYSDFPDVPFPQKEFEEAEYQLAFLKNSPAYNELSEHFLRVKKYIFQWAKKCLIE